MTSSNPTSGDLTGHFPGHFNRAASIAVGLILALAMLVAVQSADAAGIKQFTKAPTPTITGSAVVGKTLTARPGTWKPSPTKLAYQWLRGSSTIKGATRSTYVLTAADRGKTISLKVTASKAGYRTKAKTSARTAVVKSAATTGGISGKVVTDDHPTTGLAGIAVTAHLWNSARTSATQKATATTNSAGNYTLGNLAPGVYSVQFSGNDDYSAEWFNGKTALASATKLTVSGSTTTANASLAPKGPTSGTPGAIEGTVTGSDAPGVGIPGVTVQLHLSTDFTVAASTTTDADGHYVFNPDEGVGGGVSTSKQYLVEFVGTDGYAGEWYDDTTKFWEGSLLKPAVTGSITADAVLAPGGTVAGVVSGIDGSGPIAGELVIFCPVVDGTPRNCAAGGYTGDRWSTDEFGSGTGADGAFSIHLPVGNYVALVSGHRYPSGQGWQGGWAVGNGRVTGDFSGAQQLTVTRSQTTTLNPQDVPNQATFHGTITTPTPTGTQTKVFLCAFNPAQADDPVTKGCTSNVFVPSTPVGGGTSSTWTYSTVLLNGLYKVWYTYDDGFDGHDLARGYNTDQVNLHGEGGTIESEVLVINGEDVDHSFAWTW